MDKIIGFLPIEGVSRSTKQPFRFYEVSVLPSNVGTTDKLIGQRAQVLQLNDEVLANEIAYKLGEAVKAGSIALDCRKVISHYSNGRNVLDYVVFD